MPTGRYHAPKAGKSRSVPMAVKLGVWVSNAKPQQLRVLRVQRRKLRHLHVPALSERRRRRGAPGPWLTQARVERVTGAESSRYFQQMCHPQLGQLELARFQVHGRLALGPVGSRRRRLHMTASAADGWSGT